MKIKAKFDFRSPVPSRPVLIRRGSRDSERGYMLLAIMLMVTLIIVGLALEAPRIGQQIKREREEELIHRGNEYKNAIKRYYRKFGQYPVSIDQLVNTNNIRFLRKRYKDPFTGKDDWRLLHPGEVQVNALTGGVNASPQQFGQAQQFGQQQPFGQQQQTGQPQQFGQQQFGQQPSGFGQPVTPITPGANPSAGGQPGTSQNPSGTSTAGITPAGSLPGASDNSPVIGGGPVVGVSSTSKLKSIKVINEKEHYNEWQFVYDPRLEAPVTPVTPGAQGLNGANPIGGATPNQPTQNPVNGPTGIAPPRSQN